MAKFFNGRVKNKQKTMLKTTILIIGILLVIILVLLLSKGRKKPEPSLGTITLRESVSIEINSKLPDKEIFFNEISGVKTDDIKIHYNNVKLGEIGEYPVDIKINNKVYKSTLKVVDTQSPILKVKKLKIKENVPYKVEDFIEECKDNSNSACIITFDNLNSDQDGKPIDYANFKTPGIYNIKIKASDNSKNERVVATTLEIEKDGTTVPPTPPIDKPVPPKECKFGTNEYDKENHNISVDVSDNGCALDLNLYQNEITLKKVEEVIEVETKKLQNEFKKLNMNKPITLNRDYEAVLNKTGKGIVGYIIHIELIMDGEIIEDYILNSDYTRKYTVNKYNLP